MHLTNEDIRSTSKIRRLNLINSVTGIKPGNLIGTRSNDGLTNLAVFSSVVHLGSNPPMLAFIMRPNTEVRRHTYENLKQTGTYTINHIHSHFIEQAHYTSAKFPADQSEFDACQLSEEYIDGFEAPFVKESQLKLGMRYRESVPIEANNTIMVVGEVEHLIVTEEAVSENGYINLEVLDSVGISGLNSYYALRKLNDFPYARVEELPDF